MAWLGKILGSIIGFALGGPLGAIAGAALGNLFDIPDEVSRGSNQNLSNQEKQQYAFFVSVFSLLGKLANSDGIITQSEERKLESLINSNFNLPPHSHQFAKNIFYQASKSSESFESIAKQFHSLFKNDQQLLLTMLDLLLQMAMADENLHPEEENLIIIAKNIFRINDTQFQQIKAKYIKDNSKYYQILGCSTTSTPDEIKKAYRKLVMEYHPDKIIAKGLPEEFIKHAEIKFKEIQDAYDNIKKERGFN